MVFISPPRRYLVPGCLIFALLLIAIVCLGRTKFAASEATHVNQIKADPVFSTSDKPSLTGPDGSALYTWQINSTAATKGNVRTKGGASPRGRYRLVNIHKTLLLPAGANSAGVASVALSTDLTTSDKVATMKLIKGSSQHLGSATKPIATIPHTTAIADNSAALDTMPPAPALPEATPAATPTQDIWIAVRTDGQPGSGTQSDPFDGSTAQKLDTILHDFYFTPDLGVHLMGTGPFLTDANHTWHVRPGWVVSGDGMDVTTIKMVGNVAGMHDDVDVFTSDPDISTNNATIKDLTVDCNWAELALTADEGLGSRSVTDAVIVQDSPVISSTTAAFTNEDYAKTLNGGGIPAGTKILSIQDSQHAIMSANAITTGTGISVTIGGEKNIKTAAIILWGSNNLVDHVRCINSFGSVANARERFAITMSAPRSENGTNNVIQYCRVDLPQGNHGAPFALFGWPPYLITDSRVIHCIAVGNYGGFSWSNPSIGFPSGGVSIGNLSNCQIDSNTFIDCEGAAYTDTGSIDGLSITNNIVVRGQLCVGIFSATLPKRKIEISGNHFVIQNRKLGGGSSGICTGTETTTDVTICNNTIAFDTTGPGLLQFWGIGVGDVNDALICNNIVGPVDYTISNNAVGNGVILSNNRQPDGSPVPGL